MRIPKGWFVVYRPKYDCPNVFDLNERGLFRGKPKVSRDFGVCVIASREGEIKIHYSCLVECAVEKDGVKYDHELRVGCVRLGGDLEPDREALSEISDRRVVGEIEKVREEWIGAFVPLDSEGKIPKKAFSEKLASVLEDRTKARRKLLAEKNGKWIDPFIPRLVHDFYRVVYPLVWDCLHDEYSKRGGESGEDKLIGKISFFNRIYGSDPDEKLVKPDGGKWNDEEEMWECWSGAAGSEEEAERICSTLDFVLRRARESLSA